MRPFEAVLSFKSLFEGVPDYRLSSNFMWCSGMSWGCQKAYFFMKILLLTLKKNWRLILRSFEAIL